MALRSKSRKGKNESIAFLWGGGGGGIEELAREGRVPGPLEAAQWCIPPCGCVCLLVTLLG